MVLSVADALANLGFVFELMSIDVDFVFRIPPKYETAHAFAEHLRTNLGLDLALEPEVGSWLGCHLGMALAFVPNHELVDDQGIPFSKYPSSVSLTGYAAADRLRSAMVPMMLNIAMAICYFDGINGYLVKNTSTLLAHFGWHETEATLWDFQRKARLEPLKIRELFEPQ